MKLRGTEKKIYIYIYLAQQNQEPLSQQIKGQKSEGGRISLAYPLVNIQKTMENHHFEWENSLFRLGHFQ
jgi:hypothetical protein